MAKDVLKSMLNFYLTKVKRKSKLAVIFSVSLLKTDSHVITQDTVPRCHRF